MMLRTIIIDDEPSAIEVLSILLEKYCPGVEVISIANSVQSGIRVIEEKKPDLIFLDIEMPDGTGFEVVKHTTHCDYKLIFTTAYNQYALKAFKVNAIDYLLKPVDITELITAIGRVENSISQKVNLSKISQLLADQTTSKNLSIPTFEGFTLISLDQISHLSGDSNYSKIIMADGREILVSKTLKKLEPQLSSDFLRVHNSHVINKNYMEKFLKIDGGFIIMRNQAQIPVSKSKREQVMSLFVRE